MDEEPRYTWVVEIDVPEHWVKAGFAFDTGTCRDVAEAVVPFAFHDRVTARLVRGPAPNDHRQAQLKAEPPPTVALPPAPSHPCV